MNHYEIVLLIHPDRSEQVQEMLNKYKTIIKNNNGKIHRLEDCGRRPLEYTIQNIHKAHYIVLNIECTKEVVAELEDLFKFNDSIIRKLVLKLDEAVTTESHLMFLAKKEKDL
jgi:small subunit ribosomal protein S6